VVNVIWGLFNFAVGGALRHIFFPERLPPPWPLCLAALIGAAASALFLAHNFSKVRNAAPPP
jgi:hypothetical protein